MTARNAPDLALAAAGVHAASSLADRTARHYCNTITSGARLPDAPHASFAHGAAGIAYFLMRHATFGGGATSLDAAEGWATRAAEERGQPHAFMTDDGPFSAVPASSLVFHEPGVWWVQSLVAAARDDHPAVATAAARLADTVRAAIDPDVMFGSAGLLLGCAQLVESIDEPQAARAIVAVGNSLATDLATRAERDGARPGEAILDYLGPSHGWAGVVQALLRWSAATSTTPPAEALALLDRLISLRRPSGRWPLRAGSRDVFRGWCHGSAGWAQVWTQAWRVTGDGQLLAFAEQCAHDAVADEHDEPSLCCGRTGEGFAALTLFRATGDRRWRVAAEQTLTAAVRLLDGHNAPPQRLFAGALGVALLATELEDPRRSGMPVFETVTSVA
jgi:lantibiotic modifying enzyme